MADQPTSPILPWIQVGITAIVSFAGPWIAVKLSLKQFRSQKRWERQQEAYMKILESLAVVRNYYGTLFDCIVRSEVWKPDENELQKFKDARFEIEKYAAAGAYLISEASTKALQKVVGSTVYEPGDPKHEFYDRAHTQAGKAIEVLKAEEQKKLE